METMIKGEREKTKFWAWIKNAFIQNNGTGSFDNCGKFTKPLSREVSFKLSSENRDVFVQALINDKIKTNNKILVIIFME